MLGCRHVRAQDQRGTPATHSLFTLLLASRFERTRPPKGDVDPTWAAGASLSPGQQRQCEVTALYPQRGRAAASPLYDPGRRLRGKVFHLDPVSRRPRPIRPVAAFRNNTFLTKLAGVRERDRAVTV